MCSRFLFLLAWLLCEIGSAHNADGADSENFYDEKLTEINDALSGIQTRGDALCPITSLILTCGDARCESGFETRENCPSDCLPARVRSFNRQVSCERVASVVAPKTVDNIVTAINNARARGQSLRVIGSRHSANRQICTDGVVISMENFDTIIGLKREIDGSESVVVEAGVSFEELSEWLHRRDRSLGYAQLGFRVATVGGAIATGAHGSSHKHSAVLSSLVRGMTIVTSEGKIVDIGDESSDLLKAVRAHLGLFGVVTKVTLKVVPQFKLHVQVTDHQDDPLFVEHGLANAIEDCDYSFINWFPHRGRFVKGCGKETDHAVDRGAQSTLLNPRVPPGLVLPYKVILHYGMCYEGLNTLLEDLRYLFLKWQPPLEKSSFWGGLIGRAKPSDNVVGYAHRMLSSKFIATDESFFQNDREIAIPFSHIVPALNAIKAYIKNHDVHFPLFGVFLRFAPSEDLSLLAHSTSGGEFQEGEPVVFIEMITPEAVGFPLDLKEQISAPFEDMSRIMIEDFYGRPHWGKNKDWTFALARELKRYGDNVAVFANLVALLDPLHLFANDFAKNAGIGTSPWR